MSQRACFLSCAVLGLATGLAGCGEHDGSPSDAAFPGSGDPASYAEKIRGTEVSFEMVWVADGGFWIGRTEVTWDAYLPYCDFEEEEKAPPGADAVTKPSKPQDDVTPYDRDWGVGLRPAVGMSRNAAKKYCEWLSLNTGHTYRLPTEEEWTLACGAAPDDLDDHAWHYENASQMTQEVGQKKPNAHGLHDMLGNLWEYCLDPFDAKDPKRAVMRGGSWRTKAEGVTPQARLGFEEAWTMADPNVPPGVWWVPDGNHLGFRILRVPD